MIDVVENLKFSRATKDRLRAAVAQLVEHVLGKDGVIGSIPISSSMKVMRYEI